MPPLKQQRTDEPDASGELTRPSPPPEEVKDIAPGDPVQQEAQQVEQNGLLEEEVPEPLIRSSADRRIGSEDLVSDVVLGYTGDAEEDPPQAGMSAPRQSREIWALVAENADVPVAKETRSSYVWVAAAKRPEEKEGSAELSRLKKYTWNPDDIAPVDPSVVQNANLRCDVCGVSCTEVLYEFRCYPRLRPDEPRPLGGRRLHPFVSYISKECGRGLLGLQSGASKLRERVFRLLSESDGPEAVAELEEVWRHGTETMRQILMEELRYLAKTEAGVPRRAAELRKAEAVHGELKDRDDAFRAAARTLGPVLTSRDLAAVTLKRAEEQEENVAQPSGKSAIVKHSGYLAQAAEALRERRPLPNVPVPWPRSEVMSCLEALVNAWYPLRIELHDALHGTQVFQRERRHKHKKRRKEVQVDDLTVRLVYLPGCQELHSIAGQNCTKEQAQALRAPREELLQQCREEFAPLEAIHGGSSRYSRAEDREIVLPEGEKVTFQHVEKALNTITWPNCFTRNNVRPDGAPFIEAFPLGVVLNYCLGLVCSRPTRLWPNLTKLLAKFIAQERPDFRYTTVQLNKNYATKMHVDGNNHGPSYIIGLGDYTGGEVWILDETGDVELELPCVMRGFSHLRPGTKVRGRLEDCRNKWLKFDGNTPHMTMPYQGSRISIVFFTRKGWLTMLPETKETLETAGFQLPGEDYLQLSTEKTDKAEPEKKVARAPRPRKEEAEDEAVEEDEVDEDEKVDEVMRAEQDAATWPAWEWAKRLRACLGAGDPRDLGVACFGNATAFGVALQELLGEKFRIVTSLEGGGAPMRLFKRACKPQHAFLDLGAALAGRGHCEIHHKVCACTRTRSSKEPEKEHFGEDLLLGSFPSEPFLNLDPSRLSFFDDPKAHIFRSLRNHLVAQQPRAALLLAEGWRKLPEAFRASVRNFILDGKGPQDEAWGLRHVSGYATTFLELPLANCGVPLTGNEAVFMLIRDDCGGACAAATAAKLVDVVLADRELLPRCSAHALMFTNEDPRVVQAQREAQKIKRGDPRRRAASAVLRKRMGNEAKELGLQPGEAPYTEYLKSTRLRTGGALEPAAQGRSDQWIRQAQDEKVVQVNILFARARQDGLDMDNLCADLGQGSLRQGRRDDGLLPSLAGKTDDEVPELYSFSQHRTLIGQELLLCYGYPIWRLDFRSISDAEALQIAAKSASVPAIGTCLAALLAVTDLPGRERLSEPRMKQLEAKAMTAKVPDEVSSATPQLPPEEKVPPLGLPPASLDEDGMRLESKAAALLNLVNHGAFASDAKAPATPATPAKPAARSIISVLSQVAQGTEPEEETGTKRKQPEALDIVEEPQDWQVRLRKLNYGLEPLPLDMVLKWVVEAAEDREVGLADDLIRSGVSQFVRRVAQDELVSEELFRERHTVVDKLKVADLGQLAEEIDVSMRAAQLSKSLGRGVAKACLDGQTKDTMAHYVKMVVRGCDRSGWPMRRVFIKHLAQVASRSIKAGDVAGSSKASECLAEFGNVGGWKYVVTWLGEKPDVNKWPSGAVLDQLGTCLTAKAPVQLFALLHAALTSSSFNFSARSLGRLERIMAKAVAPAFQLQTLEQSLALVREVAACGRVKDRFQFVLHLMDFALEIKQEMDTQKSSRWTEMQQKLQGFLACPRVQGKVSKDSWQALAALEDDLMDTLKNTIDQHLQSSKEHEQSLEEKQQQQFEKDTLAKMDQDRQVIWSLLHEGELKEKHKAGLQKCLGRIRSMYELMQKVEPTRPCLEAWDAARAAVQSYGEMPVRCTKAFQWLQRKQLGHLGSLLDSAGLLEHLHRLGDADFGQGFPLRGRQLLLAAVEADALSKDDLKPKLDEVPEGWEQRTSRHLNLQYFQSLEAAGKMQWEWPLPKKLLPWRKGPDATDHLCQQRDEDSLLSEHKKTLSGPKGRRPYLEGQRCLLCMRDADDIHMASREHSQQMTYWKQLSDRLAMVCLDFRKVSHQDKPQTGLTTAWRGELWQALKVDPAPPRRVLAVFWLRAVLPQLAAPTPSHDTTTGLQALLDEAFTAASEMPKVDAMVVEKELTTALAAMERFLDPQTHLLVAGPKADATPAVAALKSLRLATVSAFYTRSASLGKLFLALGRAEAAILQFCSEPAFHAVVRSWLKKQRIETCMDLLSQRGVLKALQAGEAVQADAAYGLPTHFAERLSEAWYRGGALTALRPRSQPPAGWEMVFSRSVGLFYYCRVGSNRAQWRYPEAAPDVQPDVPNLLENFDRGKPHSGSVPYVELDFRGHPLCLLCKGRGLEHFASAGHAENVRVWGAIHHRLTDLERDLRVQSTFLDSSLVMLSAKENSALAQVWLSEIRRTAQDLQEDETKPKAAACAFWHLALGPSAPATRLAHVQQDLDRTLTHAGLPEPRWSTMQWKHRLPVQPGEDFPWPRPSTLKLSETTPPEVFDALSGQALKGEGIAAQADGTLWCAYCDRAVPELSSHLNRKSVEALEHVECRGQATTVVAKLRERGCQLRREGIVISKGRFHCGLCNTSGGWLRIFHHCSSHAHLAAYGNFQRNNSPEAIQAKLNSDKHKEAEESAWKAAFDAMSKIA